jgi:orotidine-5'-phosphate decarboxylase
MGQRGRERLIFALDVADWSAAERWVARLAPYFGMFKVGLELFVAAGPDAVRRLAAKGVPVLLDLKLHDIPTTVERAARAAAPLGIRMLTAHAAGGRAMLEAAARGAGPEVRVLGVTRLTSAEAAPQEVVALARLAIACGCGGVVCGGAEAAEVRRAIGAGPVLVCPGTRARGVERHDQARVVSPEEALRAGASYVVVGRAVRDAPDPELAASALVESAERALAG